MKPIIDLHQDLMLYVSKPEMYTDKSVQTGFDLIRKNNLKIVVASAFPAPKNENYLDPMTNTLIEKDLQSYNTFCRKNKDFIIIKNKKDVERVMNTKGLHGLILHIEGLNVFDQKDGWAMLERWYLLGVRS